MPEEQTNQEKSYVLFPVMANHSYKVYQNSVGGYDYYKLLYQTKDYQGNAKNRYIDVAFQRGIEKPLNGDVIYIRQAVVNVRDNKSDKYHDIFSMVILKYDKKEENQEAVENKAMAEYGETLAQNENSYELPF